MSELNAWRNLGLDIVRAGKAQGVSIVAQSCPASTQPTYVLQTRPGLRAEVPACIEIRAGSRCAAFHRKTALAAKLLEPHNVRAAVSKSHMHFMN
jgi:hypothetical protein